MLLFKNNRLLFSLSFSGNFCGAGQRRDRGISQSPSLGKTLIMVLHNNRISTKISLIDQYLMSSWHSNKIVVEDGDLPQSTYDSIATNFGKRIEHTL